MSPPQADSHVALYNRLPLIHDAHNNLRQERRAHLSASGSESDIDIIAMSDDELMQPIWRDPDVCALLHHDEENPHLSFGVWIVHRHFALESGECMVAVDSISKPTPWTPTQIPERWDQNGNEIEFMHPGSDEASYTAPSASLMEKFRDLMRDRFGVSGLGLCRATRRLEPGYVYNETTDAARRAQIVEVIRRDEVLADKPGSMIIYPSSWVVTNPGSVSCCMECNCTCTGCKCKPY
ncbi:hypothetical protein D9619_002074 [Psilocybe cf. subviscida]|uniref:Uncharacterized protein n=1 Tax=Psilocybe cf. subviscida TaxID=2480587 RepID=A0A8H5BFV8_9AGAR|nr:hypothetical protein D9619_002074 [Psilocybe cf. subviscida]